MNRFERLLLAGATALAFVACSAGATTAPPISSVNPFDPNYSKVQLAVGTANLYGTASGLNVVSTLRQPSGQSALGVDTPLLTGPFAYGVTAANAGANASDPYATLFNGGPSIAEAIAPTGTLQGTPQTVRAGTPFCDFTGAAPAGPAINPGITYTPCIGTIAPNASTFGQSGGVFAMGLAPFNHVASAGQSYSYAPYAQPFFETASIGAMAPAPLIPWGGPPGFDPRGDHMGTRDGVGVLSGADSFGDPYFLGVAEGITVFENVVPQAGPYTLTVQIAAIGNGGSIQQASVSATAQLASAAQILPALGAPALSLDGAGGGSFTLALPAGVTQGYVQIVDYGPNAGPLESAPSTTIATAANCQGGKGTAFAPVYYTIPIVPGTSSYALPDTDGPNNNATGGISNLTPTPSLCTAAQNTAVLGAPTPGDNFTVQAIGFDYPIYQAALSLTQATVPQTPAIAGPNGQSDITLSLPSEQSYESGSEVIAPAGARRHGTSRTHSARRLH